MGFQKSKFEFQRFLLIFAPPPMTLSEIFALYKYHTSSNEIIYLSGLTLLASHGNSVRLADGYIVS